MWNLLRQFRQQGFHFRRQVALGPYYADFADHRARFAIEVDGDTHAVGEGPARDRVRTEYLETRGFKVLRFSNRDVLNNPEGVFQVLDAHLTPTPNPSPRGGGEFGSDHATGTRLPVAAKSGGGQQQ